MNIPKINPQPNALCSVQFNSLQLHEILELQAEANNIMSDAWKTSTNSEIPYYRASWLELAEMLTHIGFKWWKNEHPTTEIEEAARNQAIMELIDVVHFEVSDTLRHEMVNGALETSMQILQARIDKGEGDKLLSHSYPEIKQVGRFAGDEIVPESYDQLTVQDFIEQAVATLLNTGSLGLKYLLTLSEYMGVTANELHALYVGKNTLNKFRTDKGQRKGLYNKIWNGIEDNEYLTGFTKATLDAGGTISAEVIYHHLNKTYIKLYDQGKTTFE